MDTDRFLLGILAEILMVQGKNWVTDWLTDQHDQPVFYLKRAMQHFLSHWLEKP